MEHNEQPSAIGAFFRGVFSGGASGLLMAVIGAGVNMALGKMGVVAATTFAGAFGSIALFLIPTAALFAGVMAVKHVMFDAPREYERAAARSPELGATPMIVPAISPDLAPAPAASPDIAPEAVPAQSWVNRTGVNNDAQNRIQAILNNGAMSDKSRAEAILATREQAAAENKAIA